MPLKLNIEKIWCRQKHKIRKQFVQISVHTDRKSTKEGISQQKTPKSTHSWSNHFWNPIANVSVKVQYEKTSVQNLRHSWEKTLSNIGGYYTIQDNKVKQKL